MEEYQIRVVNEKAELDKKIVALAAFIPSRFFKTLPVEERVRLQDQLEVMTQYSNILGARIFAFNTPETQHHQPGPRVHGESL